MSSTIMDVHKIVVTLSEPEIVIEPGNTAQFVVTMTNGQDAPDRLSLDVEGIDVEWYAIPVPAVNVAAGAQASERIQFRIARSSENRAGSYPFLVRVKALETGEVGVAQATLVVKPFHYLTMELDQKHQRATYFRRFNDFNVNVTNLGNAEETLDLYASDPEDGCAYEFDMDRITVKPGESFVVPLMTQTKVSSVLGGTRLYGFTASVRSVEDSYVTAQTHGQVEKHALISPLLGIFLLLLGFGGFGYWFFRPHPPVPVKINGFRATPTSTVAGSPVTLTWDVSPPGTRVIINRRVDSDTVPVADPGEVSQVVGSKAVNPLPSRTTYTLEARSPDSQQRQTRDVTIEVTPPPKPPKPELKQFTVDPAVIHAGEPVLFRWTGRGKKFLLDPGNIPLDSYATTYQATPSSPGDVVYTLRALPESPDDKVAEKQVTLHVAASDECIAKILSFAASSKVYIGEKFRLTWKVRYARSVHIEADHADPTNPIGDVGPSSHVEFLAPDQNPIKFTLTATDSTNRQVTKTITVNPVPKPLPPVSKPDPNTLPGDPGTDPKAGGTPPPP